MVAVTYVELACAAIILRHHDPNVAPSIAHRFGFQPSQNTRADTSVLSGGKHCEELQIETAEPMRLQQNAPAR